MALRNFLNNIRRDRRFTAFLRPVSKEDAPDYNRIIRRPMSVSQIRTKIDNDEYTSVEPFKGVSLRFLHCKFMYRIFWESS